MLWSVTYSMVLNSSLHVGIAKEVVTHHYGLGMRLDRLKGKDHPIVPVMLEDARSD